MAYHHGDLAAALVAAGLDITRIAGPNALTIREATRRAGVTPNAAYRHFPDRVTLLQAVSRAIEVRMAEGMNSTPAASGTLSPREQLRAVGLGYIGFALTEPGWFSVAFFGANDVAPHNVPNAPPYIALTEALDAMVHTGQLPAAARASAPWACWSAVHGFAELALRGPLRQLEPAALWLLAEHTVDAIIAGITAGR